MPVQVLAIFAAAPELCQLVREVEEDYERFLQHPGRRPKGPHAEVLPFLAEQAQDWEASASATSAGSPVPAVSPFPEPRMSPHSRAPDDSTRSPPQRRRTPPSARAEAPSRCSLGCCCTHGSPFRGVRPASSAGLGTTIPCSVGLPT